MKKLSRITVYIALAFLLLQFACKLKPLTPDLVIKTQDEIAPVITITSPQNNTYYYSEIIINGLVSDDSVKVGDDLGIISYISYEVTNDASRKGKIVKNGKKFVQDTSFGNGEIIFNEETGEFTIAISTIFVNGIESLLNLQQISIVINVLDTNNNLGTQTIQLFENKGPFLQMNRPGGDNIYFSKGKNLLISGKVGNSAVDRDNAGEIAGINWRVPNQIWSGTLDVQTGSADWVESESIFRSINKEARSPGSFFTFNPVTAEFSTQFWVPPIQDLKQFPLEITVSDLNKHQNIWSLNLFSDEGGPNVSLIWPNNSPGIFVSDYEIFVSTNSRPELVFNYDTQDTIIGISYSFYTSSDSGSGYTALSSEEPDKRWDISDRMFTIPTDSLPDEEAFLSIQMMGDTGIPSVNPLTVVGDATAPNIYDISVSNLTGADPAYAKIGDTIQVQFLYSDDGAANSGMPEVVSPTVTIERAVASGSEGIFSVELPNPGSISPRNLNFSISNVLDNVGNEATADQDDASASIQFYAGLPSLENITCVSSNSKPAEYAKSGDTIAFTYDTSRNLSSLSITSAGHNLSYNTSNTLQTSAGVNRSAQYTLGGSDPEGTIEYSINFTDRAGNIGTTINRTSSITYDRTAPVLNSITINDQDETLNINNTGAQVTFVFSEPVEGFTAGDINSPNGTMLPALNTTDNQTFTGTFNRSDNNESSGNTITVNPGSFTDRAGNPGVATVSSNSYSIDTKAPTLDAVNITSTITGIVEISFDFSEEVSGFDLSDIDEYLYGDFDNLTQGTGVDSDKYTADFTPDDNEYKTGQIISVNGSVTDAAGNSANISGNSNSFTIRTDVTGPSLNTIGISDTIINSSDTLTVDFTFSEEVVGFTASDINAPNLTISSGPTLHSGTTYRAEYHAAAGTDYDTNIITVTNASFTDPAGNAGSTTGAQSANYEVDTVRPSITAGNIEITESTIAIGETTGVVFTFSEAIDPLTFTSGDITADSGTITSGPTARAGNMVFDATLTPDSDTQTTGNQITVGSSFEDAAGNGASSGATSTDTYNVDTVAPTIEQSDISIDSSYIYIGVSTTVRLTFSEQIQESSIIVTMNGGVIGTFTNLYGNIYTAEFTAGTTPLSDQSITVTSYQDSAGNYGTEQVKANAYSIHN